MSFNRKLTSVTLGLSIALGFQFAETSLKALPAFAQASVDVLLQDSRSTLEGAKNRLSDFDSKLEFPMSDAEKEASQSKLNNFRSTFKVTSSTAISAKMINDKAAQALNLGKSACSEAQSGDRKKALGDFTAARIKLFETKQLLEEFENREAAKVATSSKRLSASARKDDKIVLANNPQSSKPKAPASTNSVNQTNVNINPNGITVDERTGMGGTSHANVSFGPGGINVQERNGTFGGTQSKVVKIGPGGINVKRTGLPVNTNTRVNIGPTGINVQEQGYPTNRNTRVNIGANGINVQEQNGVAGQYRNTNVTVNPGQQMNSNPGNAPVNISPNGVRVGVPGAASGVNINANGVQIRSNGQPGNAQVRISETGINVAGLGNLGAALGQLGAALGTTGAAINNTGAGMTGSTTVTSNHGNAIVITGHGQDKTLRLNGQNVLISGHNHNIKIIGFSNNVQVSGHNNDVLIDAVGNLNVSGHNNDVSWKNGPNGKMPNLVTSGRNNEVRRVR